LFQLLTAHTLERSFASDRFRHSSAKDFAHSKFAPQNFHQSSLQKSKQASHEWSSFSTVTLHPQEQEQEQEGGKKKKKLLKLGTLPDTDVWYKIIHKSSRPKKKEKKRYLRKMLKIEKHWVA
jgi:hypothetical protein